MLDDAKATGTDTGVATDEQPTGAFGYCFECGTWDLHGATCAACGVDFRSYAEVEPPR